MPEEITPSEKEELDALRKEKKQRDNRELSCKVSEKGAVSLYGLGRFPVTLYQEQWSKVFPFITKIEAFIAENSDKLAKKSTS